MPRLSADLVLRAPSRINPLNERELDLRGNKIPAIENLGATQDQYDTIDFSDNEIGKLEDFPLLNRIRSLIFHNNHITKFAPNLSESLPNIETLLLTNNRVVNLSDLDSLSDLSSLRYLSLLDNVVSKKPNYRLYVINKFPELKVLDFRKIKRKEREEAAKLFGQPIKKAKKKGSKAAATKTFVPGEAPEAKPAPIVPAPKAVSDAQVAFKAALENAKTMEEIGRLEKAVAVTPNDAEMNEAEES